VWDEKRTLNKWGRATAETNQGRRYFYWYKINYTNDHYKTFTRI